MELSSIGRQPVDEITKKAFFAYVDNSFICARICRYTSSGSGSVNSVF